LATWAVGATEPGAEAVDCTKLQLITAVIARAPIPQASVFRLLFNALMVLSFGSLDDAICPVHFVVVLVLYMTTSLH
jgi:hypothetical protein